jgi:hypothetical protein
MATGTVRELTVYQHRTKKIAALRDFRQKRIVLRCDRIDRFLGIQGMDGCLGAAVPFP